MKLHIPDDLHAEAERLRTGAETASGVLRLALERGLATIKAERAVLTWVDCGCGGTVYRWDHHQFGDKVTVELQRSPSGTPTPPSWFLSVRGLGEEDYQIPITSVPSGTPPFGPALYALQVIIEQAEARRG